MNPLSRIQKALKAPKSQFNQYGKYAYRSCEDILDALKLLLSEEESVVLTDEVVEIGGWHYVRATATFSCIIETGVTTRTAVAYAREAESRKGMDPAQITGAASSYARKYALGGLFGISSGPDPDETNKHDNGQGSSAFPPSPTSGPARDYRQQATQANEELGERFENSVPPPTTSPPKAQYPENVAAPTPDQRALLIGLTDFYRQSVPQGQRLNQQKLADAILTVMGRWPSSQGDVNLLKQAIKLDDLTEFL